MTKKITTDEKERPVSMTFRLPTKWVNKINKIANAQDSNKTKALIAILEGSPPVIILDGSKIATVLYEIRNFLIQGDLSPDVEKKLSDLGDIAVQVLYELLNSKKSTDEDSENFGDN